MKQMKSGSAGVLLMSALFVLIGILTLYDTAGYADRDSQVFPRTVAIILIITAGASLIWEFLRPTEEAGFGQGIWWRRVLLVVTMLITSLLIPKIGFLPAGCIAFAGGLIAAMHEGWTLRTALLYWTSGAVLMVGFFAIFKYLLYVPLP